MGQTGVPVARESSCEVVVIQIELKKSVGAKVSIVLGDRACELIVPHVKMPKLCHSKVWKSAVQCIV